MFGLVVGTIFSIIFLCGLANEKMKDSVYEINRAGEDGLWEKLTDMYRERELEEMINDALFDGLSWGKPTRSSMNDVMSYLTAERSEVIRERLFSDPLFETIRGELEEVFEGTYGFGCGVGDIALRLLLAKEGKIEHEGKFEMKREHPKYRYSHHPEHMIDAYDRCLKVVDRLIRDKYPDMRLYWGSEGLYGKYTIWEHRYNLSKYGEKRYYISNSNDPRQAPKSEAHGRLIEKQKIKKRIEVRVHFVIQPMRQRALEVCLDKKARPQSCFSRQDHMALAKEGLIGWHKVRSSYGSVCDNSIVYINHPIEKDIQFARTLENTLRKNRPDVRLYWVSQNSDGTGRLEWDWCPNTEDGKIYTEYYKRNWFQP